jgi:HSP20 family protein
MEVIMFNRLSNAFDQVFALQRALDAAHRNDYFELGTPSRGGYPAIDLFKNGEDTVLIAEIPGVKKEEIKIEVKNNLFRISGERNIEYPEDSSAHRLERRNRKFDRTIKLPIKVDAEKIKAEYQDGVLVVVLPRAESDKPKLIKVA